MVRGILVTGGAGFIGSNLVDLLIERGFTVYVLDDLSTGKMENLERWTSGENFRFIQGDIRNPLESILTPSRLGEGPPISRIFHLAARVDVTTSFRKPGDDLAVNYAGTLNVVKYAIRIGVRKLVYASSAAIYGDTEEVPVKEERPAAPISPYGLNKYASEHLLRIYHSQYGLDYTALRFFNVYGPRQDPRNPYSGVISKFIDQGLSGGPLMIYGDGKQSRDFVYVGDVAEGMLRASGSPFIGIMNLATGRETTVLDLADAVENVIGTELKRVHMPERKGEIRRSVADISLMEKELDRMETVTLREGLKRTLRWLETRPGQVVD